MARVSTGAGVEAAPEVDSVEGRDHAPQDPPHPTREDLVRARLLGDRPALSPVGRRWGWIGPSLIALLGGLLRFWHLERPGKLVFDETYYVKEGWSLIQYGTEMQTRASLGQPDPLWNTGTTDIFNPSAGSMVVHPPVGKWLIGLGEWLFGPANAFGWRFSVALIGTASILLLGRIALRLFGSVTLACITALLVAFEGLHFVMSRTGLLDIMVMFWALAAFGALLIDRDRSRARLARAVGALPEGVSPRVGPWLGWRPWRWVAGVSLALCTSTKWSGLFFLAVFGLLTVAWDIGARRAAGVRWWAPSGVVVDGPYAAVQLVVVTAVVYPLTWIGWFISDNGYLRRWAAQHPGEGVTWLPEPLRSFVKYQYDMWSFSAHLTTPHSYASKPWSWMLQVRPTSFFYEGPTRGQAGCTVDQCSQAVHSLGTVSFWWAGLVAIVLVAGYAVRRRDWRAAAIVAGVVAGYVPWFAWPDRTMFAFYSVAFEPYVALALALFIGLILRPALTRTCPPGERALRVGAVAAYLLLGVALFAFFYPIYVAEVIPYASWYLRMWFPGWI